MSETNNELNDAVEMVISDADVITVPIDDTLSNSGEAADAKAVGDALAQKADRSELQTAISVNGQSADAQGLIIVTAEDTPMDDVSQQTVAAAIAAAAGRTAADIPMSSAAGAQTIAQAIESGAQRAADEIPMSTSDDTTVKSAIDTLNGGLTTLGEQVTAVAGKTGADIPYATGSAESIKAHVDAIESGRVRTVYGVGPDTNGDVSPASVPYAENLHSEDMEQVNDSFIARTTGGELGISGKEAWVLRMLGNREHSGYVAESITMTVIPMPRQTPPAITATLDTETFVAYVGTAGTYTLTYDDDAWNHTPADYGVTVANDPLDGDEITIVWDGENDPVMTVTAVPRVAPPAITATIDRDTFVTYVSVSGTTTLTFTTVWSADPELYGITVTNVPVAGDQIKVVYVKEVRGSITVATPGVLTATGWNLYDHTNGYARVVKYSNTYGYKIGGAFSTVAFAESPSGTQQAISPTSGGLFSVPGDGYVIVTGGSSATYIYPTWSDWTEGYTGDFEAYHVDTVNLSALMTAYFPNGLCRVGDVRDEIDFNQRRTISRISRMAYSAENLAAAKASGRAYEYDEDYIYIVRAAENVNTFSLDDGYEVNDHGLEWITNTAVPVYTEILYGQNLKDKLRRDVVTVRPQNWSSGEQAQARSNIGLGAAAVAAVENGLTRTTEGAVLDARQGKVLDEAISSANTALANLDSATNTTNDILADALTCSKTSIFRATGNSYTGNVPSTQYKYGAFIVNIWGGIRLVIAQASNGEVSTNAYDGNAWGGWEKLALNSNVAFPKSYITPEQSDLDTLVLTGIYMAGSSTSHRPYNTDGLCVVFGTNNPNNTGSDWVYQYYYETHGRIFIRRRINRGSWSDWKEISFGTMKTDSAISIPSSGTSVSYSFPGITAQHELIRWNFSSSAENNPPVNLSWTTAAGSFTITNNGGTTSETIKPVFALPQEVTATAAT